MSFIKSSIFSKFFKVFFVFFQNFFRPLNIVFYGYRRPQFSRFLTSFLLEGFLYSPSKSQVFNLSFAIFSEFLFTRERTVLYRIKKIKSSIFDNFFKKFLNSLKIVFYTYFRSLARVRVYI